MRNQLPVIKQAVSATIQDLIGFFLKTVKLFTRNDTLDGDKLARLLLGMVYLEAAKAIS